MDLREVWLDLALFAWFAQSLPFYAVVATTTKRANEEATVAVPCASSFLLSLSFCALSFHSWPKMKPSEITFEL